jgi:hypothetical protein
MRFFKYLILLFSLFFSSLSYSALEYSVSGWSTWFPTQSALCTYWYNDVKSGHWNPRDLETTSTGCRFASGSGSYTTITHITRGTPDQCFYPDYKIVSQPITSLKKVMCLPVNGSICKYVGDPSGSPIVNGSITTTFSSVSKIPDPTCKEELVNPPCDPKDPYGGCYTPPDDGCTRQFDGSIVCPPDTVPPVEKGCNGATYCDRPPQGCGEGYVSGSFNGKQICIKTSPSTGNPPNDGDSGNTGEGTGTGTTTGTSTTTTTTTNQDGSTSTSTSTTTTNISTVNNFKIDMSGVIAAVNAVSAQVSSLKNELLTSISNLTSKLDSTNSKLDSTNSKLDTTNSKLTDLNSSSLKQEQLLKDIRDKTVSDDPSDQPASGASVDLTETNGLLTEIRDGIDSIKDVFSDEGKAELEQIGQASNDSRYLNAQGNAQSSLNNLANKLTFSSSSCLSDFQIQLPIFGPVNIALSQWCPLLALLKILLNLIVLLTCLRMLDATVRTI